MIYPDSFETKLHFHKIREYIREGCLSNMGRERADKMSFSDDFNKVTNWLTQTNEMIHMGDDGQEMPVSQFFDLREPLKKLSVEGLYLKTEELFHLGRSLVSARDIIHFIRDKKQEDCPTLHQLTKPVEIAPSIPQRIDKIIDKDGEIRDNASPELSRIRRETRNKKSSISGKLSSIMKRAQQEGIVDPDATVTVRDGRAVIPILSANKRKIPGIVQDESATGKTSYIEPSDIVEINNEIRELEYAERREIGRILAEISDFIRPYREDMFQVMRFLGIIDFIRSKALFAKRINAIVPQVRNEAVFEWKNAVHPLLYLHNKETGKEVVPLDMELNEKQRILLISGPNAGGKSVCLQTAGLLQYMVQCGLPVPIGAGSQMGFFHKIFMDMGDEQSIENDLSTYSSHLLNMKHFLRHCDDRSFLLIDEFGTGTEPMLGGAIAEAVLDQLNQQNVFGVITTHYTNLKHFASENEGIVNGAMLFDTHALQPLFKLEIGQPGSSFAFEIARKTGLPENILQKAKERVGEEHINFDKHLREIIRDKKYWEQKRHSVRERDKKLENTLSRYEKDLEKLKNERGQILESARQEARDIVANANREIEKTIREIREAQAEKEKTRKLRKNLDEFKQQTDNAGQVEKTQQELDKKIRKIKEKQQRKKNREKEKESTLSSRDEAKNQNTTDENRPLQKGDTVRLEGQKVPGEIIEMNGKNAMVAFGQLTTSVKTSRLTRISNNEYKKAMRKSNASASSTHSDSIREKKLNFNPNIDVRGMRAEEAIPKVLEHLDEALLCGAESVKILHGKGSGTLRQLIRQHLETLPFVTRYYDEHVQYGGAGITIAELE
ncbi:MAG: endonuclease MutS2 [Marinilabiliaceae bacterium]